MAYQYMPKIIHDPHKNPPAPLLHTYCTVPNSIKGATKSYFTHYSCVVIILFNTGLCRSAFSTIYFGKLVFRLSVLSAMLFALNQMF